MNVIFLMIPISLFLSLGFIATFIWLVKKGQFDHIDLESYRILNDDENYLEAKQQKQEEYF